MQGLALVLAVLALGALPLEPIHDDGEDRLEQLETPSFRSCFWKYHIRMRCVPADKVWGRMHARSVRARGALVHVRGSDGSHLETILQVALCMSRVSEAAGAFESLAQPGCACLGALVWSEAALLMTSDFVAQGIR